MLVSTAASRRARHGQATTRAADLFEPVIEEAWHRCCWRWWLATVEVTMLDRNFEDRTAGLARW